MKLPIMIFCATLIAAGCANVPDEQADGAAVANSDEVECRRIKVTGSRLGERVCQTSEQWAAVEEAEREANQDFLARNSLAGRNETPPSGLGN